MSHSNTPVPGKVLLWSFSILVFVLALPACGNDPGIPTGTGGAAGAGGVGGTGGNPGIAYPECQNNAIVFSGILDGSSFNETFPISVDMFQQISIPYGADYFIGDSGRIYLYWAEYVDPGGPVVTTTGTLKLPGESKYHTFEHGTITNRMSSADLDLDLVFDSSHLFACLRDRGEP